VIEKKNFSNFAPGTIPADTEYVFCNFTQHVPDTSGANPVGVEMFPGYSGPAMTFRNCNLLNCKVPAGSVRTFTKQVIHGRFNPDTESYEYHPSPIEVPE
jgi:hypothetical protein